MDYKNYKEIAKEVLERREMEPLNIQVASRHLKRIEAIAEKLDLSVSECATFLLLSYINDVELLARQEAEQIMPRN